MNTLFFDTETTGFTNPALPIDHFDQPYMVQLACQLCNEAGDILGGFSFIVRNIDVKIPLRAAEVHGITDEIAEAFGVLPEFAIEAFDQLYRRADLMVAHNIKFDVGVLETAIARRFKAIRRLTKPLFCTMEESTSIINLPPTERMIAAGRRGPKAPKLEEAVRFFFNEELSGAHDAMVDVIACRRVYFAIKERANG